jgi:hypothetical protein
MDLAAMIETLTQMDSAMLLIAFSGLLGLLALRIIGIFVKPNYYTKGGHGSAHN